MAVTCSDVPIRLVVLDEDLDIDTRLDEDVGDLTHNISRGVEIKQALVDAHLPAIKGVCALTARRLADAKLEDLGGHAHGALDLELSLLGLGLEFGADLLHGVDPLGGEGDANVVDGNLLGALGELCLGRVGFEW